MIDEIDLQILQILQDDARASNAKIARSVGMAQSATLERLRKLEERGVVTGYEVRIAPRSLDLGLLAFIFVRANERAGSVDTAEALAEHPEVLEVHHIAGEDCYLVKVRATDTEDLAAILRKLLGPLDTVQSTRTTIVLETIKESGRLPLPAQPPARSAAS